MDIDMKEATFTRVYDLLDLPEKYCFPLIALVLGYPDKKPDYQKGRLNGPGIVHYDKYHKLTSDELDDIVTQYDDPDRHLALNEMWKKGDYDHYLDWLYKVWSARGVKPEGKAQIAEILEKTGFI